MGALAAVALALVALTVPIAVYGDDPSTTMVASELAVEGSADSPAEAVADLVNHPVVAGLLLSIGIWALIFAFKIPGTGVPELVALLAIGAFLFGKHIAGLAGWEDVILVGAGVLLLAIEIFVIPGVGFAAILGVLAMGAGLVMASVGHGPSSQLFWPEVSRALTVLGVAVGLGIVWSVAAYLALRNTEMWKRFTLRGPLAPAGAAPDEAYRALASLAGSEGIAATALRPEGEVQVGGSTYPARAESAYIDPKAAIAVVSHDGRRLVVRAASGGPEPDSEPGDGDATDLAPNAKG